MSSPAHGLSLGPSFRPSIREPRNARVPSLDPTKGPFRAFRALRLAENEGNRIVYLLSRYIYIVLSLSFSFFSTPRPAADIHIIRRAVVLKHTLNNTPRVVKMYTPSRARVGTYICERTSGKNRSLSLSFSRGIRSSYTAGEMFARDMLYTHKFHIQRAIFVTIARGAAKCTMSAFKWNVREREISRSRNIFFRSRRVLEDTTLCGHAARRFNGNVIYLRYLIPPPRQHFYVDRLKRHSRCFSHEPSVRVHYYYMSFFLSLSLERIGNAPRAPLL